MKKKTVFFSGLVSLLLTAALSGCGAGSAKGDASTASTQETAEQGARDAEINVVVREDGSGTRAAFNEITGVLTKNGDTETDGTFVEAAVQNATDLVLTYVSGDEHAIGYVSLGSLNDSVHAVSIDGAQANAEEIVAKRYPLARPFHLVYREQELSAEAKDFLSYVRSKEGQSLVSKVGFLPIAENGQPYQSTERMSGKITVQGSTSVTPLMEKWIEAYRELQPDVQIEMTSNGSGAGITAVMEGNADIGMASRDLKEQEASEVQSSMVAMDGIAVIVHPNNSIQGLTLEQVRQIFTGELRRWSELNGK
ncbi:MAG: substrate-binding domain-containing protein [Ndongobacter sp.]|nr:substrate-binding domain-containing protein [Ndongobacter sp.]